MTALCSGDMRPSGGEQDPHPQRSCQRVSIRDVRNCVGCRSDAITNARRSRLPRRANPARVSSVASSRRVSSAHRGPRAPPRPRGRAGLRPLLLSRSQPPSRSRSPGLSAGTSIGFAVERARIERVVDARTWRSRCAPAYAPHREQIVLCSRLYAITGRITLSWKYRTDRQP